MVRVAGRKQSSERREVKPIEVGRYRLRNGRTAKVHIITAVNDTLVAIGVIEANDGETDEGMEWTADDGLFGNNPGPWDLVERLPDAPKELPPALNTAVKAAEDRVRELKQMVDETQTAWATACRLHEAAQRELERLEKECEVKP